MSDTTTVLPSSFVQKARSNASFLQANYSDLSAAEADVVSKKLNECADRIEELEKQLAERDAALARCVEALNILKSRTNISDNIAVLEILASLPTSAQATATDEAGRKE